MELESRKQHIPYHKIKEAVPNRHSLLFLIVIRSIGALCYLTSS